MAFELRVAFILVAQLILQVDAAPVEVYAEVLQLLDFLLYQSDALVLAPDLPPDFLLLLQLLFQLQVETLVQIRLTHLQLLVRHFVLNHVQQHIHRRIALQLAYLLLHFHYLLVEAPAHLIELPQLLFSQFPLLLLSLLPYLVQALPQLILLLELDGDAGLVLFGQLVGLVDLDHHSLLDVCLLEGLQLLLLAVVY